MRTVLTLAVVFGIAACSSAQEPPKAAPAQPATTSPPVPKLPPPPNPGTMSVVSAQAVADKGKLSLFVTKNYPVTAQETFTFTEQVQVKVLEDDGKGGKVEKTVTKPVTKQGTRDITKYVAVVKQYPIAGNDNLTVTDATGKKLSADDVLKALEQPAFVFEFTDKPNEDFLKTLKPETVVLRWKAQQPIPPALPGTVVPMPAPGAVPPAAKPKGEFDPSATEQDIIDRANAERKKAGALPLTASPLLIKAARLHSANMAKQGNLDHTLDGKGVGERLKDVGYTWSGCGENIALGQRTPAEAIESWMNSSGHRANLLSTDNTQIGVAAATATDGQRYWTMVLARSR